jgi:hypothetical protein
VLERDHAPAGCPCGVGEPDRRIAVRRADLEDPRRARGADQDPEEPARVRGDVEHSERAFGLAYVVGVAGAPELVQKREENGVHAAL